MDITLADGYSDEKGTKAIVNKPEFSPQAGGSMFSQVDPQMVGYDPNEDYWKNQIFRTIISVLPHFEQNSCY